MPFCCSPAASASVVREPGEGAELAVAPARIRISTTLLLASRIVCGNRSRMDFERDPQVEVTQESRGIERSNPCEDEAWRVLLVHSQGPPGNRRSFKSIAALQMSKVIPSGSIVIPVRAPASHAALKDLEQKGLARWDSRW